MSRGYAGEEGGEPIYKTAGFYTKTHVQIAVCNPACIKGVPKEQLAGASR